MHKTAKQSILERVTKKSANGKVHITHTEKKTEKKREKKVDKKREKKEKHKKYSSGDFLAGGSDSKNEITVAIDNTTTEETSFKTLLGELNKLKSIEKKKNKKSKKQRHHQLIGNSDV